MASTIFERSARPGLRSRRLLSAALLALSFQTPEALAQSPARGEIRGRVIERGTDRPVVGARVSLEARGRSGSSRVSPSVSRQTPVRPVEAGTAVTDDAGAYRIGNLVAGDYRLEVSRLGYRTMVVWVELPHALRLNRSFGLAIEPVALEPLRLTLSPTGPEWRAGPNPGRRRVSSLANPMSRRPTLDARGLSAERVEESTTLGEPDLFRAFQRLPGVSGRGDYSAPPWVRGAPWGFTQVMFDGLPLYDPLHLGGAGTGLPVDGLEAAYILPGARPASLSEGAAGAIHLVSRRAGPASRTKLAASPFAVRGRTEHRWLDDRLGVSATGRRSWWDVVAPPLVRGSSGRPDYHFVDASGRLDLRLGNSGLLEVGGLWAEDRIDGDVNQIVSRSTGHWGNRLGWLAVEQSFGAAGLRATLGRSAHSLRTKPHPWAVFEDARGVPTLDLVRLDLSRTVARLEADGELPSVPVEWSAGLERAHERLEQDGAEAWDRGAPGVEEEALSRRTRVWGEVRFDLGSALLGFGAAVDIVPGVQLRHPVRPSLRVRWSPLDIVSLEVAGSRNRQFAYPLAPAGRAFGPALGAGHVWILAGEELPPLTSDVWTLGLELRPTHDLTAQVTAWRRSATDIWTRGVLTLVGGARERVADDGVRGSERGRGLEVSVQHGGPRFAGEISYSLARSELTSPAGLGWPSPADRRHALDAMLGSRIWRGLRGMLLFRAESGWPYEFGPWVCGMNDPGCSREAGDPQPTAYEFRRSPAYASVDLLAGWTNHGDRVTWGVTVSLRNVLGQTNASAYRSETCFGSELISVVCDRAVGVGRFSPGFPGPTPALAVTVEF